MYGDLLQVLHILCGGGGDLKGTDTHTEITDLYNATENKGGKAKYVLFSEQSMGMSSTNVANINLLCYRRCKL